MTERPRRSYDEAIRVLAEAAPPLTDHQVTELRRIFGTDRQAPDPTRKSGEQTKRDVAPRPMVEAEEETTRYFTVDGDQVVEVAGRWGYRWSGKPPLTIGEQVTLPSPLWRSNQPWVGTITGFGSTYDGELDHVIRRASEQDEAEDTP